MYENQTIDATNQQSNIQVDSTVSTTEQVLTEFQAKLSDGRIVELREATGADEMTVAAELGDVFQANGGGAIIFQTCLIAKSVSKLGDVAVTPMRSFSEYRTFISGFKSRDWNRIKKLYDTVNGDVEGNV